jgi:Domain of unknown function (DUF4352)
MTTSLPPPGSHRPPSIPPPPPQGASAGPPISGPVAKPRRRRWWIITGIVIASVVGVLGIAGVMLYLAVPATGTYTADLTKGSGDFGTTHEADRALFYAANGYHVVNKGVIWTMTGVSTNPSRTVAAAQVTVRAVTAPPRAAFGPFVESDTPGSYWLGVDSTGNVTLNEMAVNNEVIASGKGPPLTPGTTHTLMLTCVITDGTVRLGGYVDGKLVISGTPLMDIGRVGATGMVGYTPVGSAEWVATRFARLGPGDMPANTPGLHSRTANYTGVVGHTFNVTAIDGTSYDITLVKVLDPAQGANEVYTPDAGKRFVGAEFKITATSGSVDENANNNAKVQGSDKQMYGSDFSEISAGTNFNLGDIRLHEGASTKGWVTFQVPQGVKVASVQWTPSSGFSDVTVTWYVK